MPAIQPSHLALQSGLRFSFSLTKSEGPAHRDFRLRRIRLIKCHAAVARCAALSIRSIYAPQWDSRRNTCCFSDLISRIRHQAGTKLARRWRPLRNARREMRPFLAPKSFRAGIYFSCRQAGLFANVSQSTQPNDYVTPTGILTALSVTGQ